MKSKIIIATLIFVVASGCDPYKEGRDMLRKGEYEEAAKYFKEMAEENPDDARAHHELGYSYTRLNLFNQAIDEYERALELDPDYFHSRLNLGTVYLRRDQYSQAAKQLEKAMELDPENVTAHVNLASAYSKMLKFDKAMEQINKAQELAGDDRDFTVIKQTIIESRENMDEAMDWLEEQGVGVKEEAGKIEAAPEEAPESMETMKSGDTAAGETETKKKVAE